MKRRKAREVALKALFALEFNPHNVEESIENVLSEHDIDEINNAYIHEVIKGIAEKKEELDTIISTFAKESDWALDRIALVDKSILRFALFEILFRDDVPVSVAINEAVDLAKIFSTDDSGKFINGILGHYVREKNLQAETPSQV